MISISFVITTCKRSRRFPEKINKKHLFCLQVELVLYQFRRAKGRIDSPDIELYEDLLSLYSRSNDSSADPTVLRTLVEKLQLTGISDLTQESLTWEAALLVFHFV